MNFQIRGGIAEAGAPPGPRADPPFQGVRPPHDRGGAFHAPGHDLLPERGAGELRVVRLYERHFPYLETAGSTEGLQIGSIPHALPAHTEIGADDESRERGTGAEHAVQEALGRERLDFPIEAHDLDPIDAHAVEETCP